VFPAGNLSQWIAEAANHVEQPLAPLCLFSPVNTATVCHSQSRSFDYLGAGEGQFVGTSGFGP